MSGKRKRILPKWLVALWGGFNAGVVLGLSDALLVMTFGLAVFDRTGPIIGILVADGIGMGVVGLVSTAIVFGLISRFRDRHFRLSAVLSGILMTTIATGLSLWNLSWAFNPVSGQPPDSPKNLVLITMDTLRADCVGFGGNPIVNTPFLDEFARLGVQFSDVVCPVPMTTPSHASLLTSTIPAIHGALENRYRLGPANETLTEILRQHGYRTAAFVSCFPLDHRFGLDQGFMIYNDEMNTPGDLRQASWLKLVSNLVGRNRRERSARYTNSLAIPFLKRYAKEGPFFLWVHYFDAHAPYEPDDIYYNYYKRPNPGARPYTTEQSVRKARAALGHRADALFPGLPEEMYLGEVTSVDTAINRLITECKNQRIYQDTLFVITADHGESFGEHGLFYTHGEDIYEPALHIPLLIKGEGFKANHLDDRLACITDIAPTVLSKMSIPRGSDMDGFNLLGYAKRKVVLIENFGIIMAKNAVKQRGVRSKQWKFISFGPDKSTALFQLDQDPLERNNLAEIYPSVTEELDALRKAGFRKAEKKQKISEIDQSTETLNKLKALGYVVGSDPVATP